MADIADKTGLNLVRINAPVINATLTSLNANTTSLTDGMVVRCADLVTIGDGLGGDFKVVTTGTYATNDGYYVLADVSATKQFVRIVDITVPRNVSIITTFNALNCPAGQIVKSVGHSSSTDNLGDSWRVIAGTSTYTADGYYVINDSSNTKQLVRIIDLSKPRVANVLSDLGSMLNAPAGQLIVLRDRTSTGDGGGGSFIYRTTAYTADDGIIISVGSGYLVRDGWTVFGYMGKVNAAWYGVVSGTSSQFSTKMNALLTALSVSNLAGCVVVIPVGSHYPNDTILIPDYFTIEGAHQTGTKILTINLSIDLKVFKNKSQNNTTSDLVAPLIKICNLTFDGTGRIFPDWLSTSTNVAITNPEADYRAGGCLAPSVIATGTLTVSAGGVTAGAISTGGSGYVYKPTAWITGDGYGARADLTISGGVVTGISISAAGVNYTYANLEIAGGGADPSTALFAANRRNANYALSSALIDLTKTDRTTIEDVIFLNHGSTSISDSGCDSLIVQRCYFYNCGQSDYVGNCLWSQSHGSYTTLPTYFRASSNTLFIDNIIKSNKRSVCLFGGKDQTAARNKIDGWMESCFFLTDNAINTLIEGNIAKNGVISDIVCTFVESSGSTGTRVRGNNITDCNGSVMLISGNGVSFTGNTITATIPTGTGKVKFGPYAERVGYNVGSAAIANVNIITEIASSVVAVTNQSVANTPNGVSINNNVVFDTSGNIRYFTTFSKGLQKNICNVSIQDNDVTNAPNIILFSPDQADTCLNAQKRFTVRGNKGHASQAPVLISSVIASGYSGGLYFDFGFRPSYVQIMARASESTGISYTTGVYVDQESRNPGSTGSSNITGSSIRMSANSSQLKTASASESGTIQVFNAAGTVIFSASPLGFSSSKWGISVNTSTTAVVFEAFGYP